MRRKVIAGNWKMNKTVAEALALVMKLQERLSDLGDGVEVVIAPPFTALSPVGKVLEGSGLRLGAQNCHWEASGALTGEVSAGMLKEVGCAYVILGHSERRQLFGETDAVVNRRVRAALGAGLRPIVCVGETLAEREGGKTLEVVARQLRGTLLGLTEEDMAHVVVAYEPVWAIGTGKNATSAQAQEVHAHIREQLRQLLGRSVAEVVRIQYGGSVKPENARELLFQQDVDGALVGGASLKAEDFAAIVLAAV